MAEGTEVCLIGEDDLCFANVILDHHIDEYLEFLVIGGARYRLVFQGDGQQLAQYRLDPEADIPADAAFVLPEDHPLQERRLDNSMDGLEALLAAEAKAADLNAMRDKVGHDEWDNLEAVARDKLAEQLKAELEAKMTDEERDRRREELAKREAIARELEAAALAKLDEPIQSQDELKAELLKLEQLREAEAAQAAKVADMKPKAAADAAAAAVPDEVR